jgi:hypothetical protein
VNPLRLRQRAESPVAEGLLTALDDLAVVWNEHDRPPREARRPEPGLGDAAAGLLRSARRRRREAVALLRRIRFSQRSPYREVRSVVVTALGATFTAAVVLALLSLH